MITALRRLFGSTVGKVIALAFLGLIGLAFAASDIQGTMGGSAPATGSVASVGKQQITSDMLRDRVRSGYERAREERPTLTMAQYVAGGGVGEAVEALVDGAAFEQYADTLGIRVSKRMVDARIADLPPFQGVTGKFDEGRFRQFLANARITEGQLREDLRRQILLEQLGGALGPLPRLPETIAQPYASLLLEKREGRATFIPSARFTSKAPPTDRQLQDYLTANRARYTLPERKIVRYALLDPATFTTAPVTDADVAAAYKAQADRFAPTTTRVFDQVITADEATARKLVSGDFAAAVKAAGLAASRVTPKSEAALAATLNAEGAKAAFAANDGALVGPIRVPLGFVVLKAVSTQRSAGKTLAEATPELRAALVAAKRVDAAATTFNTLQDKANNGAGFPELVAAQNATVRVTPPLLADGRVAAPGAPALDETTKAIAVQLMQGGEDGTAQVLATDTGGPIVVGEVQHTIAAAPPAFAQLKARLAADWTLSQGARQARDVARRIAKAVEGGATIAAAVAKEPAAAPIQTISARRGEIAGLAQTGRVPPELSLLFAMPPASVRTLELPGNRGWMVLALGTVDRPPPADVPQEAAASVARTLQQAIGNESVQSFIDAARRSMDVRIDDAAVQAVTAELSGTVAPAANP